MGLLINFENDLKSLSTIPSQHTFTRTKYRDYYSTLQWYSNKLWYLQQINHLDGLAENYSNSSGLAMELQQSCANPIHDDRLEYDYGLVSSQFEEEKNICTYFAFSMKREYMAYGWVSAINVTPLLTHWGKSSSIDPSIPQLQIPEFITELVFNSSWPRVAYMQACQHSIWEMLNNHEIEQKNT